MTDDVRNVKEHGEATKDELMNCFTGNANTNTNSYYDPISTKRYFLRRK